MLSIPEHSVMKTGSATQARGAQASFVKTQPKTDQEIEQLARNAFDRISHIQQQLPSLSSAEQEQMWGDISSKLVEVGEQVHKISPKKSLQFTPQLFMYAQSLPGRAKDMFVVSLLQHIQTEVGKSGLAHSQSPRKHSEHQLASLRATTNNLVEMLPKLTTDEDFHTTLTGLVPLTETLDTATLHAKLRPYLQARLDATLRSDTVVERFFPALCKNADILNLNPLADPIVEETHPLSSAGRRALLDTSTAYTKAALQKNLHEKVAETPALRLAFQRVPFALKKRSSQLPLPEREKLRSNLKAVINLMRAVSLTPAHVAILAAEEKLDASLLDNWTLRHLPRPSELVEGR